MWVHEYTPVLSRVEPRLAVLPPLADPYVRQGRRDMAV